MLGSVLEGAQVLMKEWGSPKESGFGIKLEACLIGMLMALSIVIAGYTLLSSTGAQAHPGRLAADGCHNDRKNGGRHCHGAPTSQQRAQPERDGAVYYPNCAAARAAGASPVRRGQPGYGSHLDRDNDGIGCE